MSGEEEFETLGEFLDVLREVAGDALTECDTTERMTVAPGASESESVYAFVETPSCRWVHVGRWSLDLPHRGTILGVEGKDALLALREVIDRVLRANGDDE